MSLTKRQLAARARGIGGSEMLAALGKDPRCSRLELYKQKLGELPRPDLDDEPRVRFGTLLEPVIRKEFERRIGHKVIVPRQTLVHADAPIVAHPDGWIPALNEGLEVKTADKFEAEEFGEADSDQVPVRYLVQCTTYMLVTNATKWHLAVLIGGNDYRTYVIPRDEQIADAVLAGAREFWTHIENRDPPNPETPEDVKLRWPKDLGTTIKATPEIVEACMLLNDAKRDLGVAELREGGLKMQVQQFMREHAQLVDDSGKLLATWRTNKSSKKYDVKRLLADHPALMALYEYEQPGARPLLLKVRNQA